MATKESKNTSDFLSFTIEKACEWFCTEFHEQIQLNPELKSKFGALMCNGKMLVKRLKQDWREISGLLDRIFGMQFIPQRSPVKEVARGTN